jgi:predicted MFS family arabinose efflux permease
VPPPSSPPAPARGGGFAGAVATMRVAAFRDYTIGSAFSVIGVWLQRVATGWLTWQLTESPSWLGIITFIDLSVMMLLAPIGGVIADRMDRLKLLHIAQIILFFQATAMAVCTGAGWMTIELLVALTVLMGIGHGAHGTARLSLLPNMVPKELLSQAIAVNALSFNVARFLGPAIAGIVIAGWGLTPAFAINAATFVIFSALLLRIKMSTPDRRRASDKSLFGQIAEGNRYAMRHPGIGPMLVMMTVTAFTIRALPDLLPAFAAQAFGRGVDGLAWLTSAMGLGAMIGGLTMTRRHGTRGLTRTVIWNVAFMAAAVAALAATDEFWIGVAAAVACGWVLVVNGTGTQTLIQSAVDGAIRGRVMATFTLIYQGAPALGAVALGALADHFGMRWPFLGGATLCIVVWVWMMRRAGPIGGALEGHPADGDAPAPATPAAR